MSDGNNYGSSIPFRLIKSKSCAHTMCYVRFINKYLWRRLHREQSEVSSQSGGIKWFIGTDLAASGVNLLKINAKCIDGGPHLTFTGKRWCVWSATASTASLPTCLRIKTNMNWCQIANCTAWGWNPFACLAEFCAKADSNRPYYRGANPFGHVMNQLDNFPPLAIQTNKQTNIQTLFAAAICLAICLSVGLFVPVSVSVSANWIKWKRKFNVFFFLLDTLTNERVNLFWELQINS